MPGIEKIEHHDSGKPVDYCWDREKLANNPTCEYFQVIAQVDKAPVTGVCLCDNEKCARQCE